METSEAEMPGAEVAPVDTSPKLISVSSISTTKEESVFLVNAVVLLDGEGVIEAPIIVRPNDPYGLAPIIRQWMSENSYTVEPYVEHVITDEERRAMMPNLTARQIRLGLINSGFSLSAVQAALEALPDGTDKDKALVEWEYASSFNRSHPLIAAVGVALGLTDEQIDAMWASALTL